MLSTKSIRLIINVLIFGTVVLILRTGYAANSNIRPKNRVTEPERVEQHLRVQDEIYTNLSRLLTYQDSADIHWGIDTVAAGASTIVVQIGSHYASQASYAAIVTMETQADIPLWCSGHTDSCFTVNNNVANPTITFSWITVGVKK